MDQRWCLGFASYRIAPKERKERGWILDDTEEVVKRDECIRKNLEKAGENLDDFGPAPAYIEPYQGVKRYVLVELALEKKNCMETYADLCRFHDQETPWCRLFNVVIERGDDNRGLRCEACLRHF